MARLTQIEVPPDVLLRAAAGCDEAQSDLYAAVAPATFALIRRVAGNRALAEDLFQDTMMTVYAQLGSFRRQCPIGAWVRQIALSKCLMYLRSPWHRARLGLTGEFDGASLPPELALLTTPALNVELFDIQRALESLTPTARAVVWLFEVEGFSHEEIARSFGRSISFSKTQLARAHARLRQWFEPRVDRQTCTTI